MNRGFRGLESTLPLFRKTKEAEGVLRGSDMSFRLLLLGVVCCGLATRGAAAVEVRTAAELVQALANVTAGSVLKIHPGEYPGGHYLAEIKDLTIEAADPSHPPVFVGGNNAFQLTRCSNLTLRHLACRGQSGNGFNLDDGGPDKGEVSGITLENLTVSDIGPTGNFDAIKCSGLSDLTIRHCHITGWGGQAIDLVGCHRVLITGCHIVGKAGFSQHTGPQFKGGCEDIIIEHCTFLNAGGRPIQAGGSTGRDYFRPIGARYEARRIIIRHNKIEGGECACTFTGVDGAEFHHNTVIRPTKWFFRILTETKAEGFPPARHVVLSDNTFVFRRGDIRTALNIGPDTAPETFKFVNNTWFAEDKPEASNPQLPVPESGGIYGKKPLPN